MGFRNIVVRNRVKLEYSLQYLVCRGETELKIHLSEVSGLVIQNPAVSITAVLMNELVKRNINVVFCDEKGQPQFQLIPLSNAYNSSARIRDQIAWTQDNKDRVWSAIIYQKVVNQSKVLQKHNRPRFEALLQYASEIKMGDSSNREGHAAKVYFRDLFGENFSRQNEEDPRNKYLNYGYSILMSFISREIVSFGYLTQLGIHHIGESNHYNLSCDFMEPLRPYIDHLVASGLVNEQNFKERLIATLSDKVQLEEQSIYLENAIHLYIQSLLSAVRTGELEKIRWISFHEW